MKMSISLLALGPMALAGPALAGHLSYYSADLAALNGSGVTGQVFLTYDGPENGDGRTLTVQVQASGLEPGQHAAHIHGFSGDDRKPSIAPIDAVFMPNVMRDGNDGDGSPNFSRACRFMAGSCKP